MADGCYLVLHLALPLDDALGLLATLAGQDPKARAPRLDGSSRDPGVRQPEAGGPNERRPAAGPALSEREEQVIRRLAAGWTTRAIAADLALAEPTVKTYVRRALEKLGVQTRAEAIAQAFRLGLAE